MDDFVVGLTAEIVRAHVGNNTVAIGDVPALIQQVHSALLGLSQQVEDAPEGKVPVVSVRASMKSDYIICMECGRKQKTLRRHLQAAHGMTPEQYRKDYGLSDSYPMTAPTYSKIRQEMAKSFGLGQKTGSSAASPKRRKADRQGGLIPDGLPDQVI